MAGTPAASHPSRRRSTRTQDSSPPGAEQLSHGPRRHLTARRGGARFPQARPEEEQLGQLMGRHSQPVSRKTIVYLRVSSQAQRPDLRNQRERRVMVQDLMAITHCFSARLYGLRNSRKSLSAALKSDAQGT